MYIPIDQSIFHATMVTAAMDWARASESERQAPRQETPQTRRRRLHLAPRSRTTAPVERKDAPGDRKAA